MQDADQNRTPDLGQVTGPYWEVRCEEINVSSKAKWARTYGFLWQIEEFVHEFVCFRS